MSATLLRWALGLAMLATLALWLEPARIAAELATLSAGWLLLALTVAHLSTLLSAWRWHYTATRLGLRLAGRTALADYYLAGFVNQTLPGGVLGDAWRAQRHARRSGHSGPAWRAVILERASGQLVVAALALLALLLHAPWRQALQDLAGWLGMAGFGLLLVAALPLAIALLRAAQRRWPAALHPIFRDIRHAFLDRRAMLLQLGSSTLIVLTYLLAFALAARGLGQALPLATLMLLALPALLAMLIPLSVAGWGLREGAAAGVWALHGLPPEQGVAASIAYGLVVLLASLPGALVLVLRPSAQSQLDQ